MKTKTKYITLSEAITWLALGQEYTSSDLRAELANGCFGLDYSDARQRLAPGINALMNEVQSGMIELTGKYLEQFQGNPTNALTSSMTQLQAADFRAFDITCDGLRFGQEILWLPTEYDKEFPLQVPARPEHFEAVLVNQQQLMTTLRAGTSPESERPRLSDAGLKKWHGNLSTDEKKLPQDKLHQLCVDSHPHNHIARNRVRKLSGPRPLGRPKKNSP